MIIYFFLVPFQPHFEEDQNKQHLFFFFFKILYKVSKFYEYILFEVKMFLFIFWSM